MSAIKFDASGKFRFYFVVQFLCNLSVDLVQIEIQYNYRNQFIMCRKMLAFYIINNKIPARVVYQ